MAKKKMKAGRRRRGGGAGPSRWAAAGLGAHPRLAQNLAIAGGAGVLIFGVSLGLGHLEDFVHAQPRYERRLTLEWEHLPDWLQLRENRHILRTLTKRLDLRETDRLLDAGLAHRLGAALSDPEIGWIERVERVLVRPNGGVSVRCRFRRPNAWVRKDGACYLVDGRGIRLPGRYALEDCAGSPLLTIGGVAAPPPRVGRPWPGADLASGLKLAALIADQPFRDQVERIIVANHDGRMDRHRPHLEIATDHPGSRVWWGRPPEEEYGTEVPAARKLALLETLYREWGRIDLNRAYVDVRTHPDSVSLPAMVQPARRQ